MDIKIHNLNKKYGEQSILKNYAVDFKDNAITCIMGVSGCGKTTLIRILAGLETKNSGIIEGIEGRLITMVFQEERLCENLSVKMNLRLVCKNKISDEELKYHLKEVGLEGVLEKSVSTLSGGMRRRVAIVRAMITESDIIIMDEPFKGLDEELKKHVIAYVRKNSIGKTLIVVAHDMQAIEFLRPDKVVQMS